MKTKAFYAVAASALVLASCANEDVVSPNAALQDGEAVMGFSMKTKNLTRDDGLETVYKSFGVWAVKADDQDDVTGVNLTSDANLVMRNYLVGHKGTYTPPTGQDLFKSNWYYENLGSAQGNVDDGLTKSNEPNQYLKYWDGSMTNTYFFAYAPYINGSSATPLFVPNYGTNQSALRFQSAYGMQLYTDDDEKSVPMYASNREKNEDHLNHVTSDTETGTNSNYVPLSFNHLLSQLKVAIIEDIPGYKVELLDVVFGDTDTGKLDTDTEQKGFVAFPANKDGDSHVAGKIVKTAKPIVVFDIPTGDGQQQLASTVTFSDNTMDGKYFRFALPAAASLKDNTYLYDITEGRDKRAFSTSVYTVIPNNYNYPTELAAKANSGLQFVFNFKLVAEDTGEVIVVKNARAYVGPTYTAWAANTIYTYTFRITKNATGNTEGIVPPARPDDPEEALYPIVFDSVTVAEWNEVEDPSATTEFPVTE